MPIINVLRFSIASAMGFVFLVCLFWVGPNYAVDLGRRWGWPSWHHPLGMVFGSLLIAAGAGVFVYCTGLFASRGRGTPVPVAPPSTFVATGLYRYTRNPIYLAYIGIIVGEALLVGSLSLFMYAMAMFLLFHRMVVAHEEPELRRRFGAVYDHYQTLVPRWLPARRAARAPDA